ncbi:MAG TPA: cupin domain-containing protein [Candidatus Acidoferrum sp.]|nr:cupin domain-containing protein [Candidatus Acidoferrum sp.]
MKRQLGWGVLGVVAFVGMGIWAQEPAVKKEPMTFSLECAGGDCPLLKGAPQTAGMRGGSVRLKPGESVGWHSTGQNEEALVILRGSGVANVGGHGDMSVSARQMAYIPPGTKHNVTNTGSEVLEYVWVVAPVAGRAGS